MRVFVKYVINRVKYVHLISKIQIRHFARTITGDVAGPLDENTLTGRMLIYLNNEKRTTTNFLDESEETLRALKKHQNINLRKCSLDNIMNVLNLIGQPEYVSKKFDFLRILNLLDMECCVRFPSMEIDEIFKLLTVYMNIISNRITEYKFYNLAIDELYNKINLLSKPDLIQLFFYIGLMKNSTKAKYLLRKCVGNLNDEIINNLTTEELCIICNSTFKASTKIVNKKFLERVRNYLNDNLMLLKDPALFITFVKTIRHNRYQNDDLLETISCTMFFNKTIDYYSFTGICHILALYSDYLYYDEKILTIFSMKCLEQLKDCKKTSKRPHFTEYPRGKDVKRFLWALSNLNFKLEQCDIKEIIVPMVMDMVEDGHFKGDSDSLIEIMLYLWMMKYRAYELVPYAFTKENVDIIRASKSGANKRLNLLLSCIFYEDRNLFRKLNLHPQGHLEYDLEYQLKKRPILQRVLDTLKSTAGQNKIDKFEIGCQIPSLNIVGITGYQKNIYKTVNIEVLDDYTMVKNRDSFPTGLMQLKLRLLDEFEEGLIVIDPVEINDLTEAELQDFLFDELDLVC